MAYFSVSNRNFWPIESLLSMAYQKNKIVSSVRALVEFKKDTDLLEGEKVEIKRNWQKMGSVKGREENK